MMGGNTKGKANYRRGEHEERNREGQGHFVAVQIGRKVPAYASNPSPEGKGTTVGDRPNKGKKVTGGKRGNATKTDDNNGQKKPKVVASTPGAPKKKGGSLPTRGEGQERGGRGN